MSVEDLSDLELATNAVSPSNEQVAPTTYR